MAYKRHAERLLAELDGRDAAATMRAEIDARAEALEVPAAPHMRGWSTHGPYQH